MRVRIALAAIAATVVVSCASTSEPSIDAAAVTPVQPVAAPYGAAPPAISTPGPPPGSAYGSDSHGYDASFPQYRAGKRPKGAHFSVVGVDGGKVFTTNPCLGTLWREGTKPRSLYVNSGYLAANRGRVTPGCRALSRELDVGAGWREAYALGCAATVHSMRALRDARIATPRMWWLDVELANSWSEHDVSLNRYELQGQIDQLTATGQPVGVYSTTKDWQAITGGWAPSGIDADWVAGVPVASACATTGFTGDIVWLAQEAALWPHPSGYDSDWAC